MLHGIPVCLKDNISTSGVRTTAGSRILSDFVPANDAAVVTRLKEAGAVLLGKTNLHEFAYGVTNNNPHYGAVRNPWDQSRIPGGSSGGSAAAVAAGLCFGSIGSDTGGSIRIPAALCGVVGLKPTLHRVDVSGVIPLSVSLDCVGRWRALRKMPRSCFAPWRPASANRTGDAAQRAARKSCQAFDLGLPREFFFEVISSEAEKIFESSLRSLRKLGAKTKDVSIPLLHETEKAGNQIGWAEATHYHQQSGLVSEPGGRIQRRRSHATGSGNESYGHGISGSARPAKEIHRRNCGRPWKRRKLTRWSCPLLLSRRHLSGKKRLALEIANILRGRCCLRLNRPANLAGVPAISVPGGFTANGLPLGLQFIGAENNEELLLDIARIFERENPFHRSRPDSEAG